MARELRVAIDGRALVGRRTGIGVHTAEIASRLDVDPPPLIASHRPIEDRSAIERCRFDVDPTAIGVIWQQFRFPRVARRDRADVVWAPHSTLPLTLDLPAVVSLHDLTSITTPHRHRLRTILSFNLFIARSLERAQRIAAVSRVAADEAMRGFGIRASKIEIVPNGVDDFFSPGEADGLPAGVVAGSYLLYVGTLEPRKGVADLLAAWSALGARAPRLVLAGDQGWGTRAIAAALRRTGALHLGYVDRATLRALYRGCAALIYPSREEGFGLPPLEAMACGAPVVATRVGAIPEFAEGAALLVEAGDAAAITTALRRLLGDDGFAAELGARAAERATRYRWEASAAKMTALLAEAAGK